MSGYKGQNTAANYTQEIHLPAVHHDIKMLPGEYPEQQANRLLKCCMLLSTLFLAIIVVLSVIIRLTTDNYILQTQSLRVQLEQVQSNVAHLEVAYTQAYSDIHSELLSAGGGEGSTLHIPYMYQQISIAPEKLDYTLISDDYSKIHDEPGTFGTELRLFIQELCILLQESI